MKRNKSRLVLAALDFHGPLSDAQLAWLLKHFNLAAANCRRIRHMLADKGLVRYARKTICNARGHAVKLWELSPAGRNLRERPAT